MYELLSNKQTLEKLKIEDCKKCGHPTLLFKSEPGVYHCLTCGTKWMLGLVEDKGGRHNANDRVTNLPTQA